MISLKKSKLINDFLDDKISIAEIVDMIFELKSQNEALINKKSDSSKTIEIEQLKKQISTMAIEIDKLKKVNSVLVKNIEQIKKDKKFPISNEHIDNPTPTTKEKVINVVKNVELEYTLYGGIKQIYMLIQDNHIDELVTITSEVIPKKGELVSLSIDEETDYYFVKSIANIININSVKGSSISSVGVYVEKMS